MGTVFFGVGVREQDSIANVGLHLPQIGWMGLGDVDHVECDAILILVVKLVERGNLPAKRGSCIAPENQDYWPFPIFVRELYFAALAE